MFLVHLLNSRASRGCWQPLKQSYTLRCTVPPLLGWGYRTHPKELGNNFENPSKHWEILYQCQIKYFLITLAVLDDRTGFKVFAYCRFTITIYNLYSRRKFVVRNVIVQTVFRIVSAVTIL